MTTADAPAQEAVVSPAGLPPTLDAALTTYINAIIAAKTTLAGSINTGLNVAAPPPVPYGAWQVLIRILTDSINPIQIYANDQNAAPNQVSFTAQLNPTFHTLLEGLWPPINPFSGNPAYGNYTWETYAWSRGEAGGSGV